MQKEPIPAEIIATTIDDVTRRCAPEIDHQLPRIGLLDQDSALLEDISELLAADWPDAEVRPATARASLAELWIVWTNPAGATAISAPLRREAPLARLLVVGRGRTPMTYHQPAYLLSDTERAFARVVDIVHALAEYRLFAGAALIQRRVAARLAKRYSYDAIRRAGLVPPPPPRTLEQEERAAIERVLLEANGNRRRAAELFGVSERQFYRLLTSHAIS